MGVGEGTGEGMGDGGGPDLEVRDPNDINDHLKVWFISDLFLRNLLLSLWLSKYMAELPEMDIIEHILVYLNLLNMFNIKKWKLVMIARSLYR